MITSTNQTLYHINDVGNKAALTVYCFGLSFISLFGNILVLLASIKYRAIKLDKVSIILIRNIAIADSLYAFLIMTPCGVSLVTDSWPFGDLLCYASTYLQYFLALAGINMICALNIAKLTSLIFPFRARLRSNKTGYTIAVSMWIFSNCFPLMNMAFGRPVNFDYRSYRCAHPHTDDDVWSWLDPVNSALFLVFPNLVIMVSTIILLVYAHKMSSGVNKQAVITMFVVSMVFIVSYLPVGTYIVAETWIIQASGAMEGDSLFVKTYRAGLFLKFINNSANAVIYYLTLNSFKKFVNEKVFCRKADNIGSSIYSSSKTKTVKLRSMSSKKYEKVGDKNQETSSKYSNGEDAI